MAIPQKRIITIPEDSQKYSSDLPRSEGTMQEWIEDLTMYRKYRHWLSALKWLVIIGGAGTISLLGYLFHIAYSDNRELSIKLEKVSVKLNDITDLEDRIKEQEKQNVVLKDKLSEAEKNIGILEFRLSKSK